MLIEEMLLDSNNNRSILGIPLGHLVLANGKNCLWGDRKADEIDVVVIHYISARAIRPSDPFDFESVIKTFCNFDVSSHFLINRQGKVFRLVPEEKKAWHCGGSIMPSPDLRKAVNDFSIGIELIGTDTSGFTTEQYLSAAKLSADLERRYKKKFTYVGHEDIAGKEAVNLGLRADLKVDPGALFEWNEFRRLLDECRILNNCIRAE